MAASDARNPHSVATPDQISKDMEGLDNPIPLSPQWLLPKPGENKTGMMQGENNLFPGAAFTGCSDVIKSPGHGEEMLESQKKEDMFKLTFLDMESARCDRWRDEERDTNPSIRRDRQRESDKEAGDTHRSERWVGNSSMRSFGEARQVPTDRWTEPNRDTNYDQRRESKWNTRWGPDNREISKWADVGKHSDMTHEKGPSHLANHGKHEREGDHYRPWRPSSLQSRGRAEPPHHQSQMASKGPTYGHGRGRGEITPSTFSIGRGRSNFGVGSANNYSAHSRSVGTSSNRGDNGFGEPSPFRYSRTKLLDIYRVTDVRSSNKILDGLLRVSSLTQEEPLEPLALCAPSAEESAVLKGIDKGDIIGSGASQITKDGSTARSSMDYPPSRLTKLGSKDDVSLPVDEANDKVDNTKSAHSKFLDGSTHEKPEYTYVSNAAMKSMENHRMHAENKSSGDDIRDDSSGLKKSNEVTIDRDSSIKENFPAQSGILWHSPSVSEHARSSSHDWSDEPRDIQADIGQSQGLKDPSREWENGLPDQSYAYNERKWQIGEDTAVRKCPPTVVEREHEARKIMQPSPDNLVLYYKDPQGQVQGPFSGTDIIGWFEAGYFGIDLQVRLANAPNDSPFSLLGDVMPHLRAKARPPPGFNTTKQNEATELSGRSSLSGGGMVLPGSSGIDLIGNDYRHARGSSIEAENRFLESLISGDFSNTPRERFTFTEGLPGFSGHTSSSMPPLRAESGDALNLLASRINLEQQKSLPHPYPYWPARDATPVVPSSDILRDSAMRQVDILSSIVDVPRQPLLPNVEMSVLQGLSDRSPAGMKHGAGGWPNFSVQGGLDPFKDKIELHNAQNTQVAYGMQQHKIQPPNQPSIPTVHAQSLDSPNILTDKLLSSGLVQDPQLLTLMQQQYLLQLQSKQSMSGPHLSLMDRILLLNNQHKQEEQQHLLWQQQQLRSQVLSEQHRVQRFGDPSSGQPQLSPKPVVNASTDPSELHLSHQLFQSSLQVPGSVMPDDRNSNFAITPPNVSQDLNHTVALESPTLHLPHRLFEAQKSQSLMVTDNENIMHIDSSLGSAIEKLPASEAIEKSVSDYASKHAISSEYCALPSMGQELENNSRTSECALLDVREISTNSCDLPESSVCRPSKSANKDKLLTSDIKNDVKVLSSGAFQETPVKASSTEVSAVIEVKNVEVREVKKTSDKKSRKSKSSKAQTSSDHSKEAAKASSLQQSKSGTEGVNDDDQSQVPVAAGVTSCDVSVQENSGVLHQEEIDSVLANLLDGDLESEFKGDQKQNDSIKQQIAQVNSAQRAWRPAVCVKPKSLLEIQQEEQRRVQMEIPASGVSSSVTSMSLPTPWSGVVTHSEPKVSGEIHLDGSNSEPNIGKSKANKKKSELHDLLAQEVLAKSNEKNIEVSHVASSLPPLPSISAQIETVDDDSFIEAKDTKKSRKKAAKAKGAGTKASLSTAAADVMVASSPIVKGKTKHVQTEEVLPAPPSGPSLGDFVTWKGESMSPSPAPAPAWSTDSVKHSERTSLRDILKEQEKKISSSPQHLQVSTQKTQSSQARTVLWSSTSPPSKAALPVQNHSHVSAQSKNKGEDDLFWGSPDQTKQHTRHVESLQLGNHGTRATKSTAKGGSAASLGRQKSVGGRSLDHPVSSVPAQSLAKGKRNGNNKHSEAMDFRDWCESESVRLTGSKDTSFLEFCLKQSRSEAEILLIENLGSFDPNHEFIEKFLNYMELLPADVLEIAFQSQNDMKASSTRVVDMTCDDVGFGDIERDNGGGADGSAKGSKKKGKKGKKVSPSVLGFNVVSNRIMMGEIQTVED